MAFVTKKGDYYQLVESRRVNGKPRQQVICYLGKESTVEAAYQYWRKQARGRVKFDPTTDVVTIGGVPVHGSWELHQARAKEKVTILEEYRDKAAVEAEEQQRQAAYNKKQTAALDPLNCGYWKEAADVLGIMLPTTKAGKTVFAPTAEEFKTAYRDAMKRLHPDTNGNYTSEDTTIRLMEAKAAYEYLRDWNPAKRYTDWKTPAARWAKRGVWQP